MDPITVGVVAAALVQKALDRAEDGAVHAGASALRKLVGWLREHLHPQGQQALDRVESVPDSPSLIQALAGEIDAADRQAGQESDFARELRELIDEVRQAGAGAGVDVDRVVNQTAWGNQNVQVANSTGVEVNHGQTPRRQP